MSDMSLSLIAAAIAVIGTASLFSDGDPPERFRKSAILTLDMRDQAGIEAECQPLYGAPPSGMKTYACSIGPRVVAPNPCTYPASDAYARMLCHELGHVNGWAAAHGQ